MDKAEKIAVLKRARERLSKPGAWTKWAYARCGGMFAGSVSPESEDAACWCAVGACIAEMGGFSPWAVVGQLDHTIGGQGTERFNDSCETVEPVLALFDKTIARLEGEP